MPGKEPAQTLAISALNLIATMDTVQDYKTAIEKTHPNVFQGLRQFGEAYHITLKPDAQPHALFTTRSVPLSLCHKVKEELCRMEVQ